ncbi:winged helix-turn-helix transcriptional regulator [Saccharopolyspora sp. NPDC050642]|uniref:winged helix-turn-helix transcriptional regulator n=1 Tax=Saccharopolyspora sp. NPDC050642 TaxID=3157099 RepID=UPI0034109F2B
MDQFQLKLRAAPGSGFRSSSTSAEIILQLKEMVVSGLVHREMYHQVPPKVEYSLTEFGRSLIEALMPFGEWGEQNMARIEAIPRD